MVTFYLHFDFFCMDAPISLGAAPRFRDQCDASGPSVRERLVRAHIAREASKALCPPLQGQDPSLAAVNARPAFEGHFGPLWQAFRLCGAPRPPLSQGVEVGPINFWPQEAANL